MTTDTASLPEKRLTGAHLLVAHVALLGGVVTGLLQALEHAGVRVSRRASISSSPTTTA